MMELVILLLVIVILGALAGADSFGETIRTGCGCLGLIVLMVILGLAALLYMAAPM